MDPEAAWKLLQNQVGIIVDTNPTQPGNGIIIEKLARCQRLIVNGAVYELSLEHDTYRRYINSWIGKNVNSPIIYQDYEGNAITRLRAYFDEWNATKKLIQSLPQPIAEEIIPELIWDNAEFYNKKMVYWPPGYLGLIEVRHMRHGLEWEEWNTWLRTVPWPQKQSPFFGTANYI